MKKIAGVVKAYGPLVLVVLVSLELGMFVGRGKERREIAEDDVFSRVDASGVIVSVSDVELDDETGCFGWTLVLEGGKTMFLPQVSALERPVFVVGREVCVVSFWSDHWRGWLLLQLERNNSYGYQLQRNRFMGRAVTVCTGN